MLKMRFIWVFFFLSSLSLGNAPQPLNMVSVLRIDSLMFQAENVDLEDTARIEVFLELAWELKSANPTQAMSYGRRALEMSEVLGNDYLRAIALRRLGVIYWQMGEFQLSYEALQESASILRLLGDTLEVAKTLSNVGLVLMEKGHYAKALQNYQGALKVFRENGLNDLVATVITNIGRVHQLQDKHDQATALFLQSLEIKREIGDIRSLAFSLHNLGVSQLRKGEFNQALQSLNEALRYRESLNDTREIGETSMQLGILHREMGSLNFANLKLQRAHNLFQEVQDKSNLSHSYYQIGILHLLRENYREALWFFQSSMAIGHQIKNLHLVIDNLTHIAKSNYNLGNLNEAYQNMMRAIHLKDSLFEVESRQQIIEMQYLYEYEQNLNELEFLRQSNLSKHEQIQNEKLFRNILIGGVSVFLILLFFLYNRLLAIGSANAMLKNQQEKIADSNAELMNLNEELVSQNKKIAELNKMYDEANQRLIESEKHLLDINATKDKFFSIISHDLRNPFASIVSFSRILQRDLHQLDEIELKELLHELDKSILKINNLLENLLQWSRSQTGRIKYMPDYIALYDLVQDNVNLFVPKAREKGIHVSVEISTDTVVFADMNMLNAIVRNLLSNALKYSETGTTVIISAHVAEGMCNISVKDQGVGMTAEQLDDIWDHQNVKTTYGTRDEKGSGLGLVLCKEFVEKNKGQIFVESAPGVGTEFIFTIPITEAA